MSRREPSIRLWSSTTHLETSSIPHHTYGAVFDGPTIQLSQFNPHLPRTSTTLHVGGVMCLFIYFLYFICICTAVLCILSRSVGVCPKPNRSSSLSHSIQSSSVSHSTLIYTWLLCICSLYIIILLICITVYRFHIIIIISCYRPIIISVVIILKAVEFNYMFDINRQWDRYIQEKNIILNLFLNPKFDHLRHQHIFFSYHFPPTLTLSPLFSFYLLFFVFKKIYQFRFVCAQFTGSVVVGRSIIVNVDEVEEEEDENFTPPLYNI